jgi:hypothetical protein
MQAPAQISNAEMLERDMEQDSLQSWNVALLEHPPSRRRNPKVAFMFAKYLADLGKVTKKEQG